MYGFLNDVLTLYQMKCLRNLTNMAFSMFMEIFSYMLPNRNCLPKSSKQAKRIIDDLGPKYVLEDRGYRRLLGLSLLQPLSVRVRVLPGI